MRSLKESLAAYGEAMLRAIAAQWQVAAGEPAALPVRLAAAMLEPARLQAFIEGLEEGAQAALAQMAAAGGSMRGYLLTRTHGEVRRLGPRAVEREAPWRHPASAAERLWYAGLIFRCYGRLGSYHGELYYIPPDLLAALPPQPAPVATPVALRPVGAPAQAWQDGDALALDLEALLASVRLAPVPAARAAGLPPGLLGRLAGRWRGSADPERLALLERLALRSRLIVRRGGLFQVGSQARSWLQLSPYRRQRVLYAAWRDDGRWNELWRVPSLRCEDTGWRNDPQAARGAVLEALRGCPEGWLRLADLVAALKAAQPDFARPDGDYDSWYIRDARTGQYLQGFAHWDQVEGTLIVHLVTRPLYWLGAVELGPAEGGAAGRAFRLTATGRALLGLDAAPAPSRAARFVVREDLSIRVPRAAEAYDRVRLERFARWQGREGDDDLYRIEPESAWGALNAGIGVQQIEGFLRRVAGCPLPRGATQALRSWSAGLERVTLRRVILLQTADAETLRLLRMDPELEQRFGAMVSEWAILVPEDELPQVLARLKALQLWPRLVGLG
jgi:hypothetical protein